MEIFDKINIQKNELYKKIINSSNDKENVDKAKKIYSELDNMLKIWVETNDSIKFTDEDLQSISQTAELIIKRAEEFL